MRKFCVVGFPKCGTKSLVAYLKKKYPGCQTIRPESIYKEYNPKHDWKDWKCVTITRNPIDRIHSGHQYFPHLRNLSVQDLVNGNWKHNERDQGVGFKDCIEQSHYTKYIVQFEHDYGVHIRNYMLEDLVKDPDFPQVNASTHHITWSEEDIQYVKDKLIESGKIL